MWAGISDTREQRQTVDRKMRGRWQAGRAGADSMGVKVREVGQFGQWGRGSNRVP